jgi:hypothetical protein
MLTLPKLTVKPRSIQVTTKELQLFWISDNLHGKQFIIVHDPDDLAMYEVVGYYRGRDKSVQFDILFDDCDNHIQVSGAEMMGMLENSLYIPA